MDATRAVLTTRYAVALRRAFTSDVKPHLSARELNLIDISFDFRALIVSLHDKELDVEFPTNFRLTNTSDWKVYIMAKKATGSTKAKSSLGTWNGIARVAFTSDDKKAFDKWRETIDVTEMLCDLVAEDYKVSLSFDNRTDAFMCSISCYNDASENFKFTMTSRAPDAVSAMLVGLYKHYVVTDGIWGGENNEPAWG